MKQSASFTRLPIAQLLKVPDLENVYAAVSIHAIGLVALRPDMAKVPENCFPGGVIYFRTKDNMYKVFAEDFKGHDSWVLLSKKDGSKHFLTHSDMYYSTLEVGNEFYYGRYVSAIVTEIVLLIAEGVTAEDQKDFEESSLVKEFNSIS
jgi:hypothetical protein